MASGSILDDRCRQQHMGVVFLCPHLWLLLSKVSDLEKMVKERDDMISELRAVNARQLNMKKTCSCCEEADEWLEQRSAALAQTVSDVSHPTAFTVFYFIYTQSLKKPDLNDFLA